jgi:hypothetical protein
MLEVDLSGSDNEIAHYVTQSCGVMWHVTSVKVHRSPSPFALVEMARREQIFELTARYGGSAFGTCALVHLAPKPK